MSDCSRRMRIWPCITIRWVGVGVGVGVGFRVGVGVGVGGMGWAIWLVRSRQSAASF